MTRRALSLAVLLVFVCAVAPSARAADTLEPIVEPTRKKLGDLAKSDEDVLSYIAFPNLAEKFLEERKAKEENVATYSIVEA